MLAKTGADAFFCFLTRCGALQAFTIVAATYRYAIAAAFTAVPR
jgi:hypothetical protein